MVKANDENAKPPNVRVTKSIEKSDKEPKSAQPTPRVPAGLQAGDLAVRLSTPQAQLLSAGPPPPDLGATPAAPAPPNPAPGANNDMANMYKLIHDMSVTMKTLATKEDLQSLTQKYDSIEKKIAEHDVTTKKLSTNYDNLKSEVAKVSTDVEAKMKDLVHEEVAKQVEAVKSSMTRSSSVPATSKAAPASRTHEQKFKLYCGPRDLPSLEDRKKQTIWASDKLHLYFPGKIEEPDASAAVLQAIEHEGMQPSQITVDTVKPMANSTRITVKFDKGLDTKASTLRTEARNRWSPMIHGKVTHSLLHDGETVQVKMAYPPFLAEYHGPLYDFKKEFVERVGINARDVWVNTQKKMVMYKKGGNDIILAILRFDGSVVLTDDVDAAFFPDSA